LIPRSCYDLGMRFALLAVLLGACAGSSHEAAWPKGHTSETDGGESLAPHEAKVVVAATKADDEKPAAVAVTATPAATAINATPAAVTAPAAATEEVIQSEEIIIEIDD